MRRVPVVANRLLMTAARRRDGLRFFASPGGVATGLGTAITDHEVVWIGWSGLPDDQLSAEERRVVGRRFAAARCVVVPLSERLVPRKDATFQRLRGIVEAQGAGAMIRTAGGLWSWQATARRARRSAVEAASTGARTSVMRLDDQERAWVLDVFLLHECLIDLLEAATPDWRVELALEMLSERFF